MKRKDEIRLYYLLQVNDALFPIGGYSHSHGLETYIQKGLVYNEKTAEQYIFQRLKWNLAYTDLLAVGLSYEKAKAEDLAGLDTLEDVLEASRIPMEQREAAKKMGSRFGKTMKQLNVEESGIFRKYLDSRKGKTVSHCCVYGVFCAALDIGMDEMLAHYLYAQTSAMVTNCVKSIPLSQSAGQKLLSSCYALFPEILETVAGNNEDDLCLSAPGFDVRGIQHERLYSRLYMS